MGKYELIKGGDDNGIGADVKKNYLLPTAARDIGNTLKEIQYTGKPTALALDINSPKKSASSFPSPLNSTPTITPKIPLRLVSLDVFRGITVAVSTHPSHFFFFLFLFSF